MLIFFDIDGTLVPDVGNIIPKSAVEAINRARENGHICMINTGRTRSMVGKDLTDQVEFDGFLYGCGTMTVYHGETLFHKEFSREESLQIMEGLKKYKIDAILEGCDEDYTPKSEDIYSDFFREYVQVYDEYGFGTHAEAVGKFEKLYAYVDERRKMEQFAWEFGGWLDFIDRGKGFFEIVPKGCSKASGMEYMSELLEIPKKKMVAIGDSTNDLPMFAGAGIRIAMGNSVQELKEIADYVTADLEEDGIRKALEWLEERQ